VKSIGTKIQLNVNPAKMPQLTNAAGGKAMPQAAT
jgi:hypothetical protein